MSKWKCNNPECELYGLEETVAIEKIVVINGNVVSSAAKCPSCGELREETDRNKAMPRVSSPGNPNICNS